MSLESIARDAGVGIGTLYRHFPTREALVEAVYRAELAEVAAAAEQLLRDIRRRPRCGAGWIVTRASWLRSGEWPNPCAPSSTSGAVHPNQTRASIVGAVEMLLKAGADDGSLRSDVGADDVVSSLLGIFLASASPDQTARLLDLLVAGVAASNR